jgi:hypothetical protein
MSRASTLWILSLAAGVSCAEPGPSLPETVSYAVAGSFTSKKTVQGGLVDSGSFLGHLTGVLTLTRRPDGIITSAALKNLQCDVCDGATGISLNNSVIVNGQAETGIALTEDEQGLFSHTFFAAGFTSPTVTGRMLRQTVPSPQRTLYGVFTAVRQSPAP